MFFPFANIIFLFSSFTYPLGAVALTVCLPFVQAGLIGISSEAVGGEADARSFIRAGKQRYFSMLGGFVISTIAVLIISGFAASGVLFAGLLTYGTDKPVIITFGFLLICLFVISVGLAFISLLFYGHAIVLGEMSALSGVRHSIKITRVNPIRQIIYSCTVVAVAGSFLLVKILLRTLFGATETMCWTGTECLMNAVIPARSLTMAMVSFGAYSVWGAVAGAILLLFSTEFYRDVDQI